MRIRLNLQIAIVFVASILIIGCNLGTTPPGLSQSPDELYTVAAQTIMVKLTEIAENFTQLPTKIPQIYPTETPEPPTQTIKPTATFEPTDTGTPTISPTMIPHTFFKEDFSDSSLWYKYKGKKYGFEYKNGGYAIYNNMINDTVWCTREQEYSDIGLEVDVTRISGPADGYFGVLCRFADGGRDFYAFVIGDDGFYGIARMENGALEFIGEGIDGSDIIQRSGTINQVRGVCSGNRLLLYANGHQLLEVWDNTFTTGDIGLVVGNKLTNVGTQALFDNFVIFWP